MTVLQDLQRLEMFDAKRPCKMQVGFPSPEKWQTGLFFVHFPPPKGGAEKKSAVFRHPWAKPNAGWAFGVCQ